MPCTDGGAPVTIDRLFGLVKLGITQSATSAVPLREHLLQPRHVAVRDRLGDVVGLAAVDADDDGGLVGERVAAAVDGDHRAALSPFAAGARRGGGGAGGS